MPLQRNNGGPRGMGQPNKKNRMRQVVMNDEAEQVMGGQRSPEVDDAQEMRGQGQPQVSPGPTLYGQPNANTNRQGYPQGGVSSVVGRGNGVPNQNGGINPAGRYGGGQGDSYHSTIKVPGFGQSSPNAPGLSQAYQQGLSKQGPSGYGQPPTQGQGGSFGGGIGPQGSPSYLASQARTKSMFNTPMGQGSPFGGGNDLVSQLGSPEDWAWAQGQADELNRRNPGRPQFQQQGQGNPFGGQNGGVNPGGQYSGGQNPQFDYFGGQGHLGSPPGMDWNTNVPGQDQGKFGQQGPPMGGPGGMAQAVASANAAGYKDIEGAEDFFKPGQFTGQLSGFNTQGWGSGERGSNTLKNSMGKIFSNYDVTQPGALKSVLADPKFREALPNATIVPHANEDLLDPDGPDGPMQPVDVIGNAVAGGSGQNWAWQPTDEQGGGPEAMAQLAGPGGPSQQAYMTGLPGQEGGMGMYGAPEVVDESSANQLLQWLLQQQQQGQFNQPQQQTQYI